MKRFGLIGKTLKHSFSKKYFAEKFSKENITDSRYDLFELRTIVELTDLIQSTVGLEGFNVTIPYKQEVMPFLTNLDHSAERVGAVNVVKIVGEQLIGYNSDYYGFKASLSRWLSNDVDSALVLGTGGSSKAVLVALEDLNIKYQNVSRSAKEGCITYSDIQENPDMLSDVQLIINTTPLGTFPAVDEMASLPVNAFHTGHHVFDLVYNPSMTKLMRVAKEQGAKTKNGLEMLELQAEKSWEIWNS
ncbi:MAG: shikimate dehydrogenase [Cyclobacteriaceae bacterium]